MDSNRFDDLTRALGGGQSRRRMLKALGGAALAAAGLTRIDGADAAACKSPNVRCGKGKDAVCLDPADLAFDEANCGACANQCDFGSLCCDGACVNGGISGGQGCCSDAQCEGNLICHSSYRICMLPFSVAQCGIPQIACVRDEECCVDTHCDPSGYCVPNPPA